MIPRILICEPNPTLAAEMVSTLEPLHLWVVTCENLDEAKSLISKQFFHLCLWPTASIADANDLFEVKQKRSEMCVIATSSVNDSSFVVECMHLGASDFWNKEQGAETLKEIIQRSIGRSLPREPMPEGELDTLGGISGRHPNIQKIYHLITRVKDTESNILVSGESGTGKELVARAIHDLSSRKRFPWVAVNCSAIPANLIESELFGHVKGAFTGASQNRVGRFQLAGQGTIFLDEIGELSLDLQAKLLRVIQTKEFEPVGSTQTVPLRARIVAATNQNLENAVSEKRFREDLFYRLNVIPVFMPPLRSRKSDIPVLVNRFLHKFSEANNRSVKGISEEAMRCLMHYHWPGNVRELENLIERVVVLKDDSDIVQLNDFPVGYFRQVKLDRFVANVAIPEEGLSFNDAVNEFENELILQALRSTAGNKNKAASLLKLNRTTLVEKLKRKGLQIG